MVNESFNNAQVVDALEDESPFYNQDETAFNEILSYEIFDEEDEDEVDIDESLNLGCTWSS